MSAITLPLPSGLYTIGIGHAVERTLLTAGAGSEITVSGRARENISAEKKQQWIVEHNELSATYTIKNISGGYLTPDSKSTGSYSSTLKLNAIAFHWQFIEIRGFIWIVMPNSPRNVQMPLSRGAVAPMMLEYKGIPPTNGQCLFKAVEGSEYSPAPLTSSVQPTLCPSVYRLVLNAAGESQDKQFLFGNASGELSVSAEQGHEKEDLWVVKYTSNSRTWTLQNVASKTYLSYALKKRGTFLSEKATHWAFEQLQEDAMLGMYVLKVPYVDRSLGLSKGDEVDKVELRRCEDGIKWKFESVNLKARSGLQGPIPDGIHAIHALFGNSLYSISISLEGSSGRYNIPCLPDRSADTREQQWRFTRNPESGFYSIIAAGTNFYLGISEDLMGPDQVIMIQGRQRAHFWQIQESLDSSSVTIKQPWTQWYIAMDKYSQQFVLKQRSASGSDDDYIFEFNMTNLSPSTDNNDTISASGRETLVDIDSGSDDGSSDSGTAVSEGSNPILNTNNKRIGLSPLSRSGNIILSTGADDDDVSVAHADNARVVAAFKSKLTLRNDMDDRASVSRVDLDLD